MLTYTIVLIALWLFRLHYHSSTSMKQKRWNIIIPSAILVFLAAFRYILPGTDIEGYVGDYNNILSVSIIDSWNFKPYGRFYFLLMNIFAHSGLSYIWWLAFVQILFVVSFLRIANKYSVDTPLCLIFYFTIGLFSFSITGLRQTIAMALMWNAMLDMSEKKLGRSLLLCAAAYYCHSSALIMLFAVPVYYLRNIHSYYKLGVVVVVLMGMFSRSILIMLTTQLNDEHYTAYLTEDGSYALTTFIFYSVLFIIPFFLNKSKRELFKDGDYRLVLGLAALATVSQLFALSVASAFRLSLYFTPFVCIFLANSLKNNKNATTMVVAMVSFWLLYTSRNLPYQFMW